MAATKYLVDLVRMNVTSSAISTDLPGQAWAARCVAEPARSSLILLCHFAVSRRFEVHCHKPAP